MTEIDYMTDETYIVGDAVVPRFMDSAIHEGFKVGVRILRTTRADRGTLLPHRKQRRLRKTHQHGDHTRTSVEQERLPKEKALPPGAEEKSGWETVGYYTVPKSEWDSQHCPLIPVDFS